MATISKFFSKITVLWGWFSQADKCHEEMICVLAMDEVVLEDWKVR